MEEKDKNINEKEVLVILPEEETEEQKKKRNKRIIILLIMAFVLVGDIAGILAYFAIQNEKNKGGDSDTTYIISEESISIYDNLLTFINNACGTDHPKSNKLIAVNYQDNKLVVSSVNDTNEIYVTYNHTGGIDDTLSVFSHGVPSLQGYSVESLFTISDDKAVNAGNYTMDGYRRGIVSKSLTDNYYISFTGLCSCGAYKSLVHTEYVDSGVYENILHVTQDNKTLYDLLYIITNGR